MRRVACELGAGTMTLYHYVRNKDELLELMDDAMMGELLLDHGAPGVGGWRDGADARSRTRLEEPGATSLAARRQAPAAARPQGPTEYATRPVAGRRGGHWTSTPQDERLEVVALVDDFVFGSGPARIDRRAEGARRAAAGLDGGVFGHLRQIESGAYPNCSADGANRAAGGKDEDLARCARARAASSAASSAPRRHRGRQAGQAASWKMTPRVVR